MAERYTRWLDWERHASKPTMYPPHLDFSPQDAQAFLTALYFMNMKDVYQHSSAQDAHMQRLADVFAGLDAQTNFPLGDAMDFYGQENRVHDRVRANLRRVLVNVTEQQKLGELLPIDVLRQLLKLAGKDWLVASQGNGWVFFDQQDMNALSEADTYIQQDIHVLPYWLIESDDYNHHCYLWDLYRKLTVIVHHATYRAKYTQHVGKIRGALRQRWNNRHLATVSLS